MVIKHADFPMQYVEEKKFKSRDYANMAGALLVGAGVAHIALGSIDMLRN